MTTVTRALSWLSISFIMRRCWSTVPVENRVRNHSVVAVARWLEQPFGDQMASRITHRAPGQQAPVACCEVLELRCLQHQRETGDFLLIAWVVGFAEG